MTGGARKSFVARQPNILKQLATELHLSRIKVFDGNKRGYWFLVRRTHVRNNGQREYLVVHNIGYGTQNEDVLRAFEIIGHYRW